MKIRVKAEKLISKSYDNIKFAAEIEFECSPRNYGELSERFRAAYQTVNEQVRKQIEEAEKTLSPIIFDDDKETPF